MSTVSNGQQFPRISSKKIKMIPMDSINFNESMKSQGLLQMNSSRQFYLPLGNQDDSRKKASDYGNNQNFNTLPHPKIMTKTPRQGSNHDEENVRQSLLRESLQFLDQEREKIKKEMSQRGGSLTRERKESLERLLNIISKTPRSIRNANRFDFDRHPLENKTETAGIISPRQ